MVWYDFERWAEPEEDLRAGPAGRFVLHQISTVTATNAVAGVFGNVVNSN